MEGTFDVNYPSCNSVFAALRCYSRRHNISFSSSPSFRAVVAAAFALDPSDMRRDAVAAEEEKRAISIRRGIQLQRVLEVDHRMPHQRNLHAAVAKALDQGIVNETAMATVMTANAARHQRWRQRPKWRPVAAKADDKQEKKGYGNDMYEVKTTEAVKPTEVVNNSTDKTDLETELTEAESNMNSNDLVIPSTPATGRTELKYIVIEVPSPYGDHLLHRERGEYYGYDYEEHYIGHEMGFAETLSHEYYGYDHERGAASPTDGGAADVLLQELGVHVDSKVSQGNLEANTLEQVIGETSSKPEQLVSAIATAEAYLKDENI